MKAVNNAAFVEPTLLSAAVDFPAPTTTSKLSSRSAARNLLFAEVIRSRSCRASIPARRS